jgi:hypothetical protein
MHVRQVDAPDERRERHRDRLGQLIGFVREVPQAAAVEAVQSRPEPAPQEGVGEPRARGSRLHDAHERRVDLVLVVEIALGMGEMREQRRGAGERSEHGFASTQVLELILGGQGGNRANEGSMEALPASAHRRRPFGRASSASPGAADRASSASKVGWSVRAATRGRRRWLWRIYRCSPLASLSVWHFSQAFDAGRPTTYSPCANRRCRRPLRRNRPSRRLHPAHRHSRSSSCRRLMARYHQGHRATRRAWGAHGRRRR